MTSVHRFLANDRNKVANGSLAASAVKAAAQAVFTDTVTREGNGSVTLTGSYTGADDSTFDVEITSGGTTKRVSKPTFAGAGLGTLTQPTATNAVAAQTFTVSLTDLGTDTLKASLEIEGITLQAKVAGAGGNSISITVDISGLTFTDTDFSLLEDWGTGEASKVGQQWDFGALALLSNGTIDPNTPRISFGEDPQVYRTYKVHQDGVWNYFLTPNLVRDVKAGAKVKSVTGTYSVTVTDGVTPEVYGSITSLFDFLSALSASALVEVVDIVANDLLPGGQAAIDLTLRTDPYALAPIFTGSSDLNEIQDVVVAANAKTENLFITCKDNQTVGAEVWGVEGAVSGDHPDAITDVAYTNDNAAGFFIPARLLSGDIGSVTGQTEIEIRYATRSEGEEPPPICINPIVLGIQAAAKTITFTYKPRPSGDCICTNRTPSGFVSPPCLGLEGESVVSTLDPNYESRLQSLYDWREDFITANTYTTGNSVNGKSLDRQLVDGATTIFADMLALIFGSAQARSDWDAAFTALQSDIAAFSGVSSVAGGTGSATIIPGWTASRAYTNGDVIYPSVANDNGHEYVAVGGSGTSGASEPTWPTNGTTVADNTVTWQDLGFRTLPSVPVWSNTDEITFLNKSYRSGDVIQPTSSNANGHTYMVTVGGTLSTGVSVEPTWPTNGTTVTLDSITYQDLGLSRGPGVESSGAESQATAGADLEPEVTDVSEFLARYSAQMDQIGIQVGIIPGKGKGSDTGAACWTDNGDSNWWEAPGYLPAFTNQVYHSVRRNELGLVVPTQEFAIGIVVACPEKLRENDQVIFTVGSVVGGGKTYQLGDTITLPLIAAAPAAFSGGQTGNDTHTWAVTGSVSGAFPDYTVQDGSEVAYNESGLAFTIFRGGIPFELGDTWTFAVEAAQFRWRQNGGAWSSPVDIPDSGGTALADGLSATFVEGPSPSFVADDISSFTATQPHSPSHIKVPTDEAWRWDGSSASVTVDLGSVLPIDALAVGRHFLPSGTVITIEGGPVDAGGGPWEWSESLTWASGPIVKIVSRTARYVKLGVSSATAGGIYWFWVGAALSTEKSAERLVLRRRYAVSRGGGVNPTRLVAGKGLGGEIVYANWLTPADKDNLLAMLDDSVSKDYPFVLVPNTAEPEDSALVVADVDGIEITDFHQFQPDDDTRGNKGVLPGFGMTIPLLGVIDG